MGIELRRWKANAILTSIGWQLPEGVKLMVDVADPLGQNRQELEIDRRPFIHDLLPRD